VNGGFGAEPSASVAAVSARSPTLSRIHRCGVTCAVSLVGLLSGLTGCTPFVLVQLTVDLPRDANDSTKLHLRGRVACDPLNVSAPKPVGPTPPAPGLETADADPGVSIPIKRDGMVGKATIYGHVQCLFAASAFYDANGNGVVDRGDRIGTLRSTLVKYRTALFSDNPNKVTIKTAFVE
jgi:hypothetical protein